MKFKKWIPGIMLGTMMAVMVTVPPPDRIHENK